MKRSIYKIFSDLKLYLLFTLLIASVSILLVVEHNISVKKVANLNNQKAITSELMKLKKEDIELALIQFNGKSKQLIYETQKLRSLYKYNFTEQYVLNNSEEYLADLNKLTQLTKIFNKKANEYYVEYTKDKASVQNERNNKKNLMKIHYLLNEQINYIIFQEIKYVNEKFFIFEKLAMLSFLIILSLTLWFRNRLSNVYNDILFLYSVEKGKKNYDIFSEEMDAISLRMKRKTVLTDNPAMIDQVTSINNAKGMVSSYAEKKGMKDSNFTSVTIFEIDNFSKSNRAFSQELTQAILKKVAFTISLHEQATDVIARTDYNQFTVIFSRPSKEQSFKDVDIIKQSVAELKFNVPDKGTANITVSGGFVIKPHNAHLDEAIKNAKEILKFAKENGRNRVAQVRDIANLGD